MAVSMQDQACRIDNLTEINKKQSEKLDQVMGMLIKLLPQQVQATSPVLTKEYSKEPLPLDLGLEKMRFGTEIP